MSIQMFAILAAAVVSGAEPSGLRNAAISCDGEAFANAQSVKRERLLTEGTSLLAKMKRLFAERSTIADQRLKLAEMGSISRGIKSLGNPRYDLEHLEELDAAIGQQLETVRGQATLLDLESKILDAEQRNFVTRCAQDKNAPNP